MGVKAMDLLLVEDRPEDAELTMMALRDQNFGNRVYWVKDGEEALEFLNGTGRYADKSDLETPKVILLDLNMPKMSGIEVLEHIKANDRLKSIPVVVLTTSKESADVKRAYELGANSYILKPVEFDKFAGIVKHLGAYWLLVNEIAEQP